MVEDVPEPALGAALVALGLADLRRRPMWAALWVADGLGGQRTAELAGFRGEEREVSDVWPDALRELGVAVPVVQPRRTAAPWLAQEVVAGRADARWLLRELWPDSLAADGSEEDDEQLDVVVHTVDELLDLVESARRGREPWRRRAREERERQVQEWQELVDAVIVALADGGVEAADAVLDAALPEPARGG